ncbi:MAG TPA: hypothetical protein V6D18_17060, partial [Thermosynechococcaceae cyanobacterium]
MASGTEYAQGYQQAQRAYVQGKYDEAAEVIDQLAKDYPEDPSVCLLRGHIYCYGLQQYDTARSQYESLLGLTSDPEFTGYANEGLSYIGQTSSSGHSGGNGSSAGATADDFNASSNSYSANDHAATTWQDSENASASEEFNPDDFNFDAIDNGDFGATPDLGGYEAFPGSLDTPYNDRSSRNDQAFADPFAQGSSDPFSLDDAGLNYSNDQFGSSFDDNASAFTSRDRSQESVVPPSSPPRAGLPDTSFPPPTTRPQSRVGEDETLFTGGAGLYDSADQDFADQSFGMPTTGSSARNSYNAFAPEVGGSSQGGVDFLDEFDEFDDLGNLSDFDLSENSAGFTSPVVGPGFGAMGANTTETTLT